jgi:hypothetical protein
MSERKNNKFLGKKRENETRKTPKKQKRKNEETNESIIIDINERNEEEKNDDKNMDEYEEEEGEGEGEDFRKNDTRKEKRKNSINENIRNLFEVRIKKMRVRAKELLKKTFTYIFVISWIITVASGLLEAKVRLRYVVLMVTMLFFLRMCD